MEAPHITKMYEKYKDQGFQVLAVNGWDEPREKVEVFVNEKKLTHPVALKGSVVAQGKYKVFGYPTSFWLDREGNIVHRDVGWHGPEHLEAKLTELLGKGG